MNVKPKIGMMVHLNDAGVNSVGFSCLQDIKDAMEMTITGVARIPLNPKEDELYSIEVDKSSMNHYILTSDMVDLL